MLPWLTLLALAAAVANAFRTPKSQWRAYRTSFAARHGIGVQVGITVLCTLTLAMVLVTLRAPGAHPRMEHIDALVVLLGIVCAAADVRLFARSQRRE